VARTVSQVGCSDLQFISNALQQVGSINRLHRIAKDKKQKIADACGK
jgi:hypothetical protein